jgi:hypothetical protein
VSDLTELSCNSQATAVSRNLYAALHRLEQEQSATLIWADAICINQHDTFERNQQVSIMDEIYRRASRVFIWIGPGDDNSMNVIAMIRTIAHRIRTRDKTANTTQPLLSALTDGDDDPNNTFAASYHIKPIDFPTTRWLGLWQFYQADWFHRVWVIQEIQQASDAWLLCGSSKIEWDSVSITATCINIEVQRDLCGNWDKEYFPSMDGFINTGFIGQPLFTRGRTPFLAVLDRARRFKATDPRDKVFALLHHHANHEMYDRSGRRVATRVYPQGAQNVSNFGIVVKYTYASSTGHSFTDTDIRKCARTSAFDQTTERAPRTYIEK